MLKTHFSVDGASLKRNFHSTGGTVARDYRGTCGTGYVRTVEKCTIQIVYGVGFRRRGTSPHSAGLARPVLLCRSALHQIFNQSSIGYLSARARLPCPNHTEVWLTCGRVWTSPRAMQWESRASPRDNNIILI